MKFILVVNPNSGKKESQIILEKIQPIFNANNTTVDIIETTHAGHAKELANQTDLINYDGFIAIGGDGTLFEIVNGMLKRQDNVKIPIGIIPGGSGNSYMHDLSLTNPIDATNAILKGHKRLVDTIKINTNNNTQYAMNMIGWGLVADVGKTAEKCRWLGPSRYTILSILEVFRKKNNYATIIIDNIKIEDNFTFIIACNSIHVGRGMKMAPKAVLDDGLIDLIVVRSNISRFRLLQTLAKLFKGTHIYEPEVSYYQANQFSLHPKENVTINIDGETMDLNSMNVENISKNIEIFSKNDY